VQEILDKAIAAQVKKRGLPKKTDLRLIWETLEVLRWVDSNTAIVYGGLHEVVRENPDTRFDVDFLFTLKFDAEGNWKIVKTRRMSEKELKEEQ
jgi:NTP pyrophosphatase (non-canonical NTP hydrolase)